MTVAESIPTSEKTPSAEPRASVTLPAKNRISARNVVLTGFMGTGKSTVGRLLAETIDYRFVDTDTMIEERHGPIPEIFSQHGEERFREMEREVARELSEAEHTVIATGGRFMLDPANIAALATSNRTFALVATPEEIVTRVTADGDGPERPLLSGEGDPGSRVRALLDERAPAYARFPQLVTTGRTPAEIVTEMVEILSLEPVTFLVDREPNALKITVGVGVLGSAGSIARELAPTVLLTESEAADRFGFLVGDVDATLHVEAGNTTATRAATTDESMNAAAAASASSPRTIVAVGDLGVLEAAVRSADHVGDCRVIACPTTVPAMLESIDAPEPVALVVADVATLQHISTSHLEPGSLVELRGHVVDELRAMIEG